MHGFLLIGNNAESLNSEANKLSKNLSAKLMPYTLSKIEDVRNLNSFTNLALNEKTLIFIEDIHEATPETLNAFLKNLEEPQENLYFALTAPSIRKVLPTIVSRCQIIKLSPGIESQEDNSETQKFLEMSIGEKFLYIDKIKDRGVAIEFIESVIKHLHASLHSNELPNNDVIKNIEKASDVLKNLKSNGNVGLQLTYFVSNLV